MTGILRSRTDRFGLGRLDIVGRHGIGSDLLAQCDLLEEGVCAIKIIIDEDEIVRCGLRACVLNLLEGADGVWGSAKLPSLYQCLGYRHARRKYPGSAAQ